MNILSRSLMIGLASGILAACGDATTSSEYLERARGHLAKNDVNSATLELKNAVAADPQDAEIRFLLGKTYFESGDMESAEKELARARQLGSPAAQVLPLLAQALLPLGKYEDLIDLNPESLPAEAQAIVLAAQGLAILAQGDPNEAGKPIEKALAASPSSAYARVAKARLLAGRGELPAAREQLDQALASAPEYGPAWSLLGDIEQQEQHTDAAENAYSEALDADPANIGDRIKRALVRIEAKRTELAEQDIDLLRQRAPQHPGVFFAQGLLQLQKNDLEGARVALEQAAGAGNTFPMALFYLAVIHTQQGNQGQAENYARQFLAIAPNNALGRNLAATLALRAGDFPRAESLVRPVVAADDGNVAALNTLAAALLAQGKTDEGLDLLTRAATLQPGSPKAQTRLAAGLLAAGQADVGAEHLQKALELDPKFQPADLLLVMNRLREQDLEGAIQAAEIYRDRNPESATPYNLLGRIYLATNDRAKAQAAFATALEIAPGDPAASQSLAALAMNDKDYVAARRYYDALLEKHADYLPAQMQLAALDATQGNEAGMVERLRGAMNTHPEAPGPRLALAHFYLAKGDARQALDLLNEPGEDWKEQPAVLNLLATVYLVQKDFPAAKSTIERLLRLQPEVAQHHFQLALAQQGLGDVAGARTSLEKAVALTPQHVPARLALARLYLATQEQELFEQQLAELHKLQPDHPDVRLLDATLAQMQGRNDEALTIIEDVHAKTPTPMTAKALAIGKVRRGDGQGGRKVLEDWVSTHPRDTDTRMALAELYAAQGSVDRAIAEYRTIVESDEPNVDALNNLAWYLRGSDPKQASGYAERARMISPDSPAVLDTLAMVQLANKELEPAQQSISRAMKLAPDNPAMRYHAARIMHARGDTRSAILILQPAVKGSVDFPEKADAVKFLAELENPVSQ